MFENPQELDTHLDVAAARVSERADYRPLIATAFGEAAASINRYQLLSALTSYVISLIGASDLPNQTLAEEPLQLGEKEKQALKHFLLSLTDRCAETKLPPSLECKTALMRP